MRNERANKYPKKTVMQVRLTYPPSWHWELKGDKTSASFLVAKFGGEVVIRSDLNRTPKPPFLALSRQAASAKDLVADRALKIFYTWNRLGVPASQFSLYRSISTGHRT
jgi:hypothetical protein